MEQNEVLEFWKHFLSNEVTKVPFRKRLDVVNEVQYNEENRKMLEVIGILKKIVYKMLDNPTANKTKLHRVLDTLSDLEKNVKLSYDYDRVNSFIVWLW